MRRQFQENAPAIPGVDVSVYQAKPFHSGGQLDRGVMPDQKRPREISHRYKFGSGEPLDRKQGLMLLRRQSLPRRGRLAEGEKDTQLIAKLRQRLVINRDSSIALDLGRA